MLFRSQVSGLIEKATVAGENGFKVFVVPLGQSKFDYYERQIRDYETSKGVVKRTYYLQKTIDLEESLYKEYGMEVKEVNDIYGVLSFVF